MLLLRVIAVCKLYVSESGGEKRKCKVQVCNLCPANFLLSIFSFYNSLFTIACFFSTENILAIFR